MSFRAPLWASILTVLAVAFFGSLSWWQYQRGLAKADIIARQSDQTQPSFNVNESGILPAHGRRIVVSGHWLADQQVLLDNQTHKKKVGVQVLTPLVLDGSGHLILVNRGWIQASLRRDELPAVAVPATGRVSVSGYWRGLSRAGLATDDGSCEGMARDWPMRLNYPSHDLLVCLYEQALANGQLLLDPDAADGFVRVWHDLGIPPERHYGYAVQWGGLAITAFVLFIVLNLKRRPS